MKKENKKPAAFYAYGSDTIPTDSDIESRKRKSRQLLQVGVDTSIVREEERENPYRVEAIVLINKGQEVPRELRLKIKEFDEAGMKKYTRKQKAKA